MSEKCLFSLNLVRILFKKSRCKTSPVDLHLLRSVDAAFPLDEEHQQGQAIYPLNKGVPI